jgi:hypothetical protein
MFAWLLFLDVERLVPDKYKGNVQQINRADSE